MALKFKRNAFYVDDQTFQSMNTYLGEMQRGEFAIYSDEIVYIDDYGELVIPKDNVTQVQVVHERNRLVHKILFAFVSTTLLVGYLVYDMQHSFNTLLLSLLVIIFVCANYYLLLFNRNWLMVEYKTGKSKHAAYFSFDWRLFPWVRREILPTWLINRGDCYTAKKLINKLHVVKSS